MKAIIVRSRATRVAIPLFLLVSACTEKQAMPLDEAATSAAISASSGFAPAPAAPPMAQSIGAAAGNAEARRVRTAGFTKSAVRDAMPLPSATQTAPQTPSMIIRNGDVLVQVDSVEASIAAVRALAATLGGYIGNVSLSTGEQQVRSASLEMKVPANRFDDAMAGMVPLGKVERSTAMAEDVGEEFVDISARVTNAKRLEARLVELLARRTGKLEDVLAVERELARVREEIERYEGRIRFLASRVAMSTITVAVHERYPIVSAQPGVNVIGRAFRNMWRNAVHVVAKGIELLGIVIPLFALLGIGALAWKWWRRRGARRPAPTEVAAAV